MSNNHIHQAYDNDLKMLNEHILLMATKVEKMIDTSILALKNIDIDLAKSIIELDLIIDKEEIIIDRKCLEILAQRQPLGQDLRLVISILKMVTYIERLGDLAAKIGYLIIKLNKNNIAAKFDELEEMSMVVKDMLKKTIEAFITKDIKKASKVISQDSILDEIYQKISKQFIMEIGKNNKDMQSFYHLLSIAKWLERMGDHTVKLAELIIFLVKGQDIRHQQTTKSSVSLF
jgi:phosphate transport system protein